MASRLVYIVIKKSLKKSILTSYHITLYDIDVVLTQDVSQRYIIILRFMHHIHIHIHIYISLYLHVYNNDSMVIIRTDSQRILSLIYVKELD